MIRLYTSERLEINKAILLSEKQTHYLKHVMRVRENDDILVFNGQDGEFQSTVIYKGKKEVLLNVICQTRPQKKLSSCGLAVALIKKENLDLIFQKATELGVTDIYPLLTERTIVRQFNSARAEVIVREAAEQCERLDIPLIHPLMNLRTFLNQLPSDFTPVHLAERLITTKKLSEQINPLFIIGPEGGFSETENQLFQNNNAICSLHLGDTILRAETAAIAVLSAWRFRLF